MKTKISSGGICSLAFFSFVVFLSGCGPSFQVAGYVERGRGAMLAGDNQAALANFQSALQTDPNYVYGTDLRAGVLSYLGRAQYLNGQLGQARETLEKAIAQDRDDNVARLYLGLALARQADRGRSVKEIGAGMKGIRDFVNYIKSTFSSSFGQFWDQNRSIRDLTEKDLAMISSGNIDWQQLMSDGETLGKKIEEEPALARRQEQNQLDQMYRGR